MGGWGRRAGAQRARECTPRRQRFRAAEVGSIHSLPNQTPPPPPFLLFCCLLQNSTEQLDRLEKAFDEVKARLLRQVGAAACIWPPSVLLLCGWGLLGTEPGPAQRLLH